MKRPIFKKTCKKCKKEFEFRAFNTEVKSRIFCSRDCANKGNSNKNSKSKLGEKNPMYGKIPWNFKDRIISSDGYYLITIKNRKVKEHRHIMEKIVGRKLKKSEVVHHIDGNKLNNRFNNLKLCKNEREHRKYHLKKRDEKGKFCATEPSKNA